MEAQSLALCGMTRQAGTLYRGNEFDAGLLGKGPLKLWFPSGHGNMTLSYHTFAIKACGRANKFYKLKTTLQVIHIPTRSLGTVLALHVGGVEGPLILHRLREQSQGTAETEMQLQAYHWHTCQYSVSCYI